MTRLLCSFGTHFFYQIHDLLTYLRSYDEGSIVLVVTGSYVDAYQIADEEVMYVSRFVSVEDDKNIEACAVVSIDPGTFAFYPNLLSF